MAKAAKHPPAVQPDLPIIQPEAVPGGPAVRGHAVLRPLADVVANPWNPNRMTDHMFQSVVHGLRTDGWVASQALLIWGTDQQGRTRNMIIDGEHRWRAAQEAGFKEGPMVFLEGMSEAEAKALTVKLNQKRGDWNDEMLSVLLRDLASSAPADFDMAMDLGIVEEDLMKLLAEPPAAPTPVAPAGATLPESPPGQPAEPAGPAAPPQDSGVRMVQLYLDASTHPVFTAAVKELADAWGINNVTDTVREAVRRAGELLRGQASA